MVEIKVDTIPRAWRPILEAVLLKGEHIENKIELQENISTIIKHPGKDMMHKRFTFKQDQMDIYAANVLAGINDTGFEYTYGERLRCYGPSAVDQIAATITRLNNDRNTRRATGVLWFPDTDSVNIDVPCWTAYNATIRNDFLNFRMLFRSHDMFGGFPANGYMGFKIQEHIAIATQSKPGTLQINSWNPHIHLTDFPAANEIIGGIA